MEPDTSAGGDLPRTGSGASWPLLAGGALLLIGATLLFTGRRTRA
ncbi:LPXTG cell wall anchor domain-containing protein [uncultured Aeromicrobium sp.]